MDFSSDIYFKITNPDQYPGGYFFHAANSRSGHNFIKKNIQSWTDDIDEKNRKFINLENKDVSKILQILLNDKTIPTFPNSIYVLSVRDLLNWFTSYFYFQAKHFNSANNVGEDYKNKIIIWESELEKNPHLECNPNIIIIPDNQDKTHFKEKRTDLTTSIYDMFPKILDKWLILAKEFIGETNFLPQFVKVYYNEFFLSEEYRKSICDKVGGSYNDTVLNYVCKAGSYSTFDKDKFQGRAQSMNVLERYKLWKPEHGEYLTMLKEHEAMNFYLNNFEISTKEKQFIDSI